MSASNFTISQHPFFSGMSEDHLRILTKSATEMRFAEGARIFREGEAANRLYLVQSGTISLQTRSAGHPIRIATIDAGEALGWSWLFPPFFWHFEACADEPVDVIVFDAVELRKNCDEDKALGYELMKRVAETVVDRLHATRLKLVQALKHDFGTTLLRVKGAK